MWLPYKFGKSRIPKVEAATSRDKDGWFVNRVNGGITTDAGVTITNDSALQIAAVFACIRSISEDVAKLPLQVFERLEKGRLRRADHSLWEIFNVQPNPEMDAISYRNTVTAHVLSYGNAYSEIIRDGFGTVIALWPLDPRRVTPVRKQDGTLVYEVRADDGTIQTVDKSRIFSIPGFGFDGIRGYNVITYARQSLGLARASEKFGAKFFGNGAKASLAMEIPQELSEKASTNLVRSISKQVAGDNVHSVLLGEQGATFKTLSLSQKDSQYLETRQFSIPEICRWFRIPPHKVFDLERATFSNIEQQNTDYVTDALTPWFVRWEQAIQSQLLTDQDRAENIYTRHNANALLRGDMKTRFDAYASGITNGWLLRNEAREREDLNPIDGLDEPLQPMNMAGVNSQPVNEPDTEAIIEDIADRIASCEHRGLSARVSKAGEDRDRFNEWASSFYDKQEEYAAKCLSPITKDMSVVNGLTVSGILGITMCDDPAEYIKTWNRKSEIIEIIQEALLCTHK